MDVHTLWNHVVVLETTLIYENYIILSDIRCIFFSDLEKVDNNLYVVLPIEKRIFYTKYLFNFLSYLIPYLIKNSDYVILDKIVSHLF